MQGIEMQGEKKIKIAIVGPSSRFLSGISYYTIRLANALSKEAAVIAILYRNMLPSRLFPGWKRVGEDLTQLHFAKRVKVCEILDWYNPITWFQAAKAASGADVILLEWWTSSVAHMCIAILLLLFKKIPIVIEYHEVLDPLEQSILPVRIYAKFTSKLLRKWGTHFVVHSVPDKKLICTLFGVPGDNATVIPHGLYDHYKTIDKDLAQKTLDIEEKHVILFFGLLRPYKGVKYLVQAFSELPEQIVSDTRLLIAGETWEDRESVELARCSPYKDKITFINRYIADEEISFIFSAADVLVIPYLRASQSGVAHIGMAYGMPIIASLVGGLEESLSEYEGTVFTTPENLDELKMAIIRTIGNGRRYTVPACLRWENIAKNWVTLFGKLVNQDDQI
ncbi:MAG: glycosyltransferase [Methanomicrobiales archaeon]|nr:glycosyltransferase [Methanomicrobiales archaeon]